MAYEEPIAQGATAGLCFVEPREAIDMILATLDEETKEILLDASVSAWAAIVPDDELETHYEKAVSGLDAMDLDSLANWHGARTERSVVPSAEFLLKLFPTLGEDRREALELASGMRLKAAVYEETLTAQECLETTFALLSDEGMMQVAHVALGIYISFHAGSDN
jgi:hypothetical protein